MQKNILTYWDLKLRKELQLGVEDLSRIVKKMFLFLSVSSMFIGGTGFFKTFIGYYFLGMTPNFLVCLAVSLFAFAIYTLDKIADMDKDAANLPERLSFLKGRKNLATGYALSAYSLAIVIVLLDMPLALPILIFPLAVNLIYGSKPISSLPRLKDLPFIKNFIVAITWALGTALLPAMHSSNASMITVASVFYFMLIKTFIDTVLYDIRDVKGDRDSGVKTIPVLIGPRKTIAILLLLEITLLPSLEFIDVALRPLAAILVLFGFGYIVYFRERRNPLALDLCVEGEWMLATCLFSILRIMGLSM